MKASLLVLCLVFFQEELPYKPNEEFEVKMNFSFKERPSIDANRVELERSRETQRARSNGPLPYLSLNVRVLKQAPEETRIRIIENGGKAAYNKKIDLSTVIKLDLGYTDDIKDHVAPYEYTILFLKDNKDPVSRVVIYFHEDGTYLVNGQVRGKI